MLLFLTSWAPAQVPGTMLWMQRQRGELCAFESYLMSSGVGFQTQVHMAGSLMSFWSVTFVSQHSHPEVDSSVCVVSDWQLLTQQIKAALLSDQHKEFPLSKPVSSCQVPDPVFVAEGMKMSGSHCSLAVAAEGGLGR